jgi:hypothetical protein
MLMYNLTELLRTMVFGRGLKPCVHMVVDLVLSCALVCVGIFDLMHGNELEDAWLKNLPVEYNRGYANNNPIVNGVYSSEKAGVVTAIGAVWSTAGVMQGFVWIMEGKRLWG